MIKRPAAALLLSVMFVFAVFNAGLLHAASEISIYSFYGKYDVNRKEPGRQAMSLRGPKLEKWKAPARSTKPYKIGVSFPHLKDSYWLAVNYGVIDEALKLGVGIALKEAGGYGNLATQQKQLKALEDAGVDGIILGSISYKDNNKLVSELTAKGIPVVEVINDIEAGDIAAKALVSFYDMGYYAGEYLVTNSEDSGVKKQNVLFLPGPQGSGWADDTLDGFKAATEFFDGEINILDVQWGDTGEETQKSLLEQALKQHPDIDCIVGNAVAASVAPAVLKKNNRKAMVVSTYITPPVYAGIRNGSIAGSPADMTVDQGRIALGMMVRILEGQTPGNEFPFRAGPFIPVVTKDNIGQYPYEMLFGPKGFKAVFELMP